MHTVQSDPPVALHAFDYFVLICLFGAIVAGVAYTIHAFYYEVCRAEVEAELCMYLYGGFHMLFVILC